MKASPVPEPRPKTKVKVKVIGSRPPPVVIREPMEQEIAARLNNPSESDNSNPGAEIPPKVITSIPHDCLLDSTSFSSFNGSHNHLIIFRTLLELQNRTL